MLVNIKKSVEQDKEPFKEWLENGCLQVHTAVGPKWILWIHNWIGECNTVCNTILTHYQTANFRLFQIKRVCRRKWQVETARKHYGKRRNCSLQAISLFPTVFSKGLFPRGIKRCHCVGMG